MGVCAYLNITDARSRSSDQVSVVEVRFRRVIDSTYTRDVPRPRKALYKKDEEVARIRQSARRVRYTREQIVRLFPRFLRLVRTDPRALPV